MSAHHAGNRCVVAHENVHDEILMYTPFGNLQYICNRFRDMEVPAGQVLHPPPAELFELLCDSSEDAHESAATFLAVELQPRGKRAALLDEHSERYRIFYRNLADPLNCLFPSSYFQVVFARQVVSILFAPPLAELIEGWRSGSTSFELATFQQPDTRLRRISERIETSARELRQLLFERIKVAASSTQGYADDWCDSDRFWEQSSTETATGLERIIAHESLHVLIAATRDILPTIEVQAWASETKFYTSLFHKLDPQRLARPSGALAPGYGFVRPTANVVTNPDAPPAEVRSRWPSIADRGNVFQSKDGAIVLLLEAETTSSANWIHCTVNPQTIAVARCSDTLLREALAIIRIQAQMGMLILDVPPMIVPWSSGDFQSFAKLHNERVSTVVQPLKDGAIDYGTQSLFWYLHGDFAEQMGMLTTLGETELLTIVPAELAELFSRNGLDVPDSELGAHATGISESAEVRAKNEKFVEDHNLAKTAILIVVTNKRTCGYFIRLVPFWVSGSFVGAIRSKFPEIHVGLDLSTISADSLKRLQTLTPSLIKCVTTLLSEW